MNTTEKKMAAAILRFEDDRVTGPASLRVSRLPAADKGGKWEICGICDGFEAWEGCLQYILDNTAAVRSWIGSDAHPGIEFFLRDHYFNSGSKNTGKILQRALNDHGAGIAVDGIPGKQTRQTLQTVLAESGERKLLDSLYERRESFYCSCRQFSTFGNGWRNRCKNAYEFAAALA